MTHNRCVCRFHSFVLLVFSLKDRRMAELKTDNNDGNTVRPDPLYFFLEPQIRCLKTDWKENRLERGSAQIRAAFTPGHQCFYCRTGTRLNFTLWSCFLDLGHFHL